MKNIDQNIALPSVEEIERYQNGTLDSNRAYEIELLAQENPLVSDALDGFAVIPAFSAIPSFDAVMPAAKVSATGVLVKSALPWWHLNGWIIGVMVGATGSLLLGTIYNVPANVGVDKEAKELNSTDSFEGVALSAPADHYESDWMEKDNVTIKESPSSLVSDKLNPPVINQADIAGSMEESIPKAASENFVILSGKSPEPALLISEVRNDEGIKPARLAAVQIAHINGYKVADYSELRPGTWKPIPQVETGTNASRENKESGSSELFPQQDNLSIAYMEYLTQCMNEFDRGFYDSANEHFEIILKQYPSDVNALFYSAMSDFRLGHYNEALVGYDSVLVNMISVFNEEARFYKAKSLRSLGLKEDAKTLFAKIASENGFYAEKAGEELMQCE